MRRARHRQRECHVTKEINIVVIYQEDKEYQEFLATPETEGKACKRFFPTAFRERMALAGNLISDT